MKKNPQKKPKETPAAATPTFALSLNAGQNTASAYSFNSPNNPGTIGAVRPPVPETIGPDPRNANANLNLSPVPSVDAGNGVRVDFNHGFRVQMPPGTKTYELRVWDADTQTLIADLPVPGGALAVGERKYFIRYHLEVTDKETGKLVAVHDYNCENRPVMIIIPDGGLGDNLAWMPYAEEFRKKYRARVTCVCGNWLTRIIREQYPELDFASVAEIPNSQGYYASYFCAIFPPERKSWRPSDHQNFGMQGSIAKILGVDPLPRKVRFPYYPERPIAEPYVCISVLATNPSKYWNYPDGWNILCRYLKRLGYRVFVIDRDHDLVFNKTVYSVPAEAEDCTGLKPITERMAMLQHAEFFVGLPSGLSWLAWSCNTPVVLISGFTMDGSEFPTPYRVFNQNFCHGCWNDSNLFFDAHAPIWCPRHLGTPREIECTRSITPKMVIDAVNRIPAVCTKLRPPVTFALPVHNPRPELFSEVLQSVTAGAAGYGNAEILIYDDGSTEPAAGVLIEEYRRRHPELISVEYGTQPEGTDAGYRRLLARAKGRYFLPLDQNTLLLPLNLPRLIKHLEEHPEIVGSYGKKSFFTDLGPEKRTQGTAYSAFQSLYAPQPVPDAAVLRTEVLRQCGAWESGRSGRELARLLALRGDCEYDTEARTLSRRPETAPAPENAGERAKTISRLLESYPESRQLLEQGLIPEEREGLPAAALAGAGFFLHQKNREIAEKILLAARKRFPLDPGVRMSYLQYLAGGQNLDAFKAEWDAVIHDYPEPEIHYSILAPAAVRAVRRGIFSMKQREALKSLDSRREMAPGAAIDAWHRMFPAAKVRPAAETAPIRISVIIPAVRGRYLAECVDSVVQAFAAYGQTEILLYNDASAEPSLDLLMQMLQAKNPDLIRVFRGEVNLGAAMARMELIRHARGEYLVCFDDDDVMLPFDVKKVVDYLDAHPRCGISYSPKYLFNETGYLHDIHGSEFSRFYSFFAPKININAAFIRKTALLESGGFQNIRGDKRAIGEDVYMMIRLFYHHDVRFEPEVRALYRKHGNQLTSKHFEWDDWITMQPCEQFPELTGRILAGDIPDPDGPDAGIVRGLMGAVMYLHQKEPAVVEPIVQAALKYFPEDPGVPEARLLTCRMGGRLQELLDYYPQALELFKDTVRPRLTILEHVLGAMKDAKMTPPPALPQLYRELTEQYLKLSPAAEAYFQNLPKPEK